MVNHRNGIIFSYISLAILCVAGCSSDLSAQEMTLELDPANTKVEFTLPDVLHTVHGTFAMKSGLIHFNPSNGSAAGFVLVDVKSGQSGNSTRDRKMHKEVLESARYPDIVLRPDRVEGQVAADGASTIQVHGTFSIHGAGHEITIPVRVEISSGHWTATSHFPVPYVKWELKNPSTFVLRVDQSVDIDIQASGDTH